MIPPTRQVWFDPARDDMRIREARREPELAIV